MASSPSSEMLFFRTLSTSHERPEQEVKEQKAAVCSFSQGDPLFIETTLIWSNTLFCNSNLFFLSEDFTTVTIHQPGIYRITCKILAYDGTLILWLYVNKQIAQHSYASATPFQDCLLQTIRPLKRGDALKVCLHEDPKYHNVFSGGAKVNEFSIERIGSE